MVQLQALNYILNSRDISFVTSNNLNQEFFSDYTTEFNYIKEHIEKYGNIPDKESFINKFPNFDIINVHETKEYLLDELYKDRNARSIAGTFNKIRSLLINNKIEEATNLYMHASDNVSKNINIKSFDILHNTSRYDAYIERTQDYKKYYVKTGFPEIDKTIGGWDRQEELATIVARPGVGKCLQKGTLVLMANGEYKKVEDVAVGDKVQSLNSTNTVLALHNGESSGYRIKVEDGTSFTVSENHILTLIHDNQVVDMVIEDYLKLDKKQASTYYLYRPPVNYSTKKLPMNP